MEKINIYKPNIKKIRGILNHAQIYTILVERNLDLVKKTVELINGHLKKKTREITEEEINQVRRVLNIILMILMEKPLTPILKDLANELIVLAAFWNETIAKSLHIREMIYALRRMIDTNLSFTDLIQSTKVLLRKFEEIQRFSPPSFEISKHYLKAIEEQQNKKSKK